jgi:cardiolipin synthase
MLILLEAHLTTMIVAALMLTLVVRVLRKERRSSASFAWILAIVLVPYVGIPSYLIFGGRKLRSVAQHKQTLHRRPTAAPTRLLHFDNPAEDVLTSTGVKPPSIGNALHFIPTGEEAYHRLCEAITAATTSIYIETYILKRDTVGKHMVSLLAKKAAEGLDVRLLLDSYGCLGITRRFVEPITRAGGRVAWFLPLLPVRRDWSLNLRNHRKIVIVDGQRAVIGGMNYGEEYMGPAPDPKRWIDSTLMFEGPAARDVLEVFCSDWNFAAGDSLDNTCGGIATTTLPGGADIAQIVASGPDVAGDPLFEAVLSSIHAARRRVWMVTPYFAPGEELFRALLIQARIGRDVRLIMPARSNHAVADLVRGPYLRELAAAGAKILLREGRMIHAKCMIFDDATVVTGSTNFDLRSLYLNFEVALFSYSRGRIDEIAAWVEELGRDAPALIPTRPSRLHRFAEQLALLVSPLL